MEDSDWSEEGVPTSRPPSFLPILAIPDGTAALRHPWLAQTPRRRRRRALLLGASRESRPGRSSSLSQPGGNKGAAAGQRRWVGGWVRGSGALRAAWRSGAEGLRPGLSVEAAAAAAASLPACAPGCLSCPAPPTGRCGPSGLAAGKEEPSRAEPNPLQAAPSSQNHVAAQQQQQLSGLEGRGGKEGATSGCAECCRCRRPSGCPEIHAQRCY